MSTFLRLLFPVLTTFTLALFAGCGDGNPQRPSSPTPPPPPPAPVVTASAYILPNAVTLNDWAFGDEPVVINKGERLRWVNADNVAHAIVADSPNATDFSKTDGPLQTGGEQSFIMTKPGTTGIHCSIHPNMTGTLTVR